MPSTYTVNLGIEKPATGEQSGTWGDTTNTNFDILDQGINGAVRVTLSSAGSSGSPNALVITNGAASDGRNKWIEFYSSGDLGGNVFVQLQPNDAEKIVFIRNSLASSRSVLLFQGTYNAGRDLEIPAGVDMVVKFDGGGASAANVTDVYNNLKVTGLVAGTADINGGTVDGTVIGGASAAALTATTVVANTSVNIAGDGATVTGIKDEDNMASNSATKLATQQSIKAYVDSQVGTVDTLAEILANGNETGSNDIDVDGAQKVAFRDSAIYIHSSTDGQLDIVADTEIQIAATTIDINGAIVASGDIAAASLDISGNVDIDGVLNVDAIDIDGAVQLDNTLTVGVDDTGYDVKFYGATGGAYMLWDQSADDLILAGAAGLSVAGASTLTGVVTANAGVTSSGTGTFGALTVDTMTLNASSITGTSNLTLDVAGDINLDAGGADVTFKNSGTEFGRVFGSSDNFYIQARQSDKDMIFQGIDGASTITALTLDMSNAGQAIFNKGASFADHVYLADNAKLTLGGGDDGTLYSDGTNIIQTSTGNLTLDVAGDIKLDADSSNIYLADGGTDIGLLSTNSQDLNIRNLISDKDIYFQGNDGGSNFTALTLDMSNAGRAFFNVGASFSGDVAMGDSNKTKYGAGEDLILYSDGTNGEIEAPNGDLTLDVAGNINLDADGGSVFFKDAGTEFFKIRNTGSDVQIYSARPDADMKFEGVDGSVGITALRLDMSAAGTAIFAHDIEMADSALLRMGAGGDFIATSDGANALLYSNNGNFVIDSAGEIYLDADGADIIFQDAGAEFGRISQVSSDLAIYCTASGHEGLRFGNGAIVPTNNAGASTDNACNLGGATGRFSDLYLAGGVFLGGTGTANKLDDYEEGTWSPQIYYQNATDQGNATNTAQTGYYTKIGRVVTLDFRLVWNITGSPANDNIGVKNLPFVGDSDTFGAGGVAYPINNSTTIPTLLLTRPSDGGTVLLTQDGEMSSNLGNEFGAGNSKEIRGTVTYFTDA